ncbi:hypothetical protein J6590_087565 [Homalodisca vitripennis]|nr:hypothetical protein J6590_087565 [Homalodisca vitripennis]
MCWLPSLVLSGGSRAVLVLDYLLLPLRRSWRREGSEDGFDVAGHGAPQPWCGCAAAGPSAVAKGGSLIRSPEGTRPLLIQGSLHEGPKIMPKFVVGAAMEDAVVRGVDFSAVTEFVLRVPEAVMVLTELAMPRQKLSEYMVNPDPPKL